MIFADAEDVEEHASFAFVHLDLIFLGGSQMGRVRIQTSKHCVIKLFQTNSYIFKVAER